MSKPNNITVDSLFNEIALWAEQDNENPGAWNMFMLQTLPKLKADFTITMQYLSSIDKIQFDFISDIIEELVYHFQKNEMLDMIEALYKKFYGDNKDTYLYRENIKNLKNCIKE